MPKVSSVFIETLKNHKVDRFFCVPGESYLPVMNELVSNPIIDVVTCRHEGGAGFMAVADAKCTGEPGIAYVSRGPGATNISIAVHSAHQGGIPIIVFVGQVSRKNLGKMHLQEMDFTKTFADMTKLVEEVKDPEDLPKIVSNAFKVAKKLSVVDILAGGDDFYAVRLLEALGVDINHCAFRLSFVHYTRQQDVNAVIEALDEVL